MQAQLVEHMTRFTGGKDSNPGLVCHYFSHPTKYQTTTTVKTVTSCRSLIIPFTDYLHVMPMKIHLLGKLKQFSPTSCKCSNRPVFNQRK